MVSLIGRTAPSFTLPDNDGKIVTLDQLKGKPVVLNFWASWCPPCRMEMPDLNQFSQDYQAQVHVLGINATFNDDKDKAKKYIASEGLLFPIVFDESTISPAAKAYGVTAFPTTVFIDANGVVRDVLVGAAGSQDDFIQRVQPLLK
ncbi:TlpA family protein disulfide reductase [Heliophilum fasciatum]|uniref:TlpA family protein disulfide reductase n=1 Tax=Heliophilum fasciatum TaxID=35700 RepID=UPI00140432E4|nr:TlpA disulfide reductase family protein [Heliophilum fasciatum]MCW2277391.1 thiol-disulfide isomerase/thioredoxin [Heliophilum fasciatum]